jgi:fructose transport system permease protein
MHVPRLHAKLGSSSIARVPLEDTNTTAVIKRREPLLVRAQHFVHEHPTFTPTVVLLVSVVCFSILIGPRFFSPFNLSLILQQVTIIALLGSAQTLIILTAGIDLSVGATMVMASIVMGRLSVDAGLPVPVAIAMSLVTGVALGLVNGVLVALLKLPAFITTLGTWNMYFALTLWYSKNQSIDSMDIEEKAPNLLWLGTPINFFGVHLTLGSIAMVLVFVLLWHILNRTAFGRHVYAVGDDKVAARLAGIRVNRVLIAVYVISGLICAFAAWALIGRVGSVTPHSGTTANLDSITAVVVGGTSLFGGRGAIFGTLIGALIVGVFQNGLALAGADALWEMFATGALIVVAVVLDQWIRGPSTS